jgi:hypothetical protein
LLHGEKLQIFKQQIPKRREIYFQKQRKLHDNYDPLILEAQGAEHGKNAVNTFKTDFYLKVRAKVKVWVKVKLLFYVP